ncbi:MAG TPA: cupredoxin domain-containing protein [Nitrospira sp.]|nr:cupredoxin domain-containing protein [Nitrospira sp.]
MHEVSPIRRRPLRCPTRLIHGLVCIVAGSSWLGVAACENNQTLALTTEDFRFVPDQLHAAVSRPLTLSLYNAGREVHEFDSPVLLYSATPPAGSTGIELRPGQSAQVVVAPPAGTYLYICRRKGHAYMTGTLIVQ